MYTIAAVLYPSLLATSLTLPMEILNAASQMAGASARGTQHTRFLLCATRAEPVKTATGLDLTPDCALEELPPLDLLLLPAIWRSPLPVLRAQSALLATLPTLAASGTRIGSVGSASFLLAEAGLLNGQPATTHWNAFDAFARRYPLVELKRRHLITQSSNLYCVGSVNSIADLMVHLIEEWFGNRIAQAIENQFSPEIRRSFRAAAYQNEPDSSHHDELVLEAQQWLQENLGQRIELDALASQLDISRRSLNRRFHSATGISPQAYLQGQRMAVARDLLRQSNLSVAEIAWQVGLQDVGHFGALFKRYSGETPARYRKAVRGKLFAPEQP
ncbi:MAG: helix-turn-helix domain-containing protein [Pseudomonadota bacterium]